MKTKNFLIKYKSIFCINLQITIEVGGDAYLGRCHAQSSACSFELPSAEVVQKPEKALFKLKQYIFPLHSLYLKTKLIVLISFFVLSFVFSEKILATDIKNVSQDLIFLQELKKDFYEGKPSRLPQALVIFDKYEPLLTKENLAKMKNADVLLAAIRSAEAVSCYLTVNASEYRTMSRLLEAEKLLKRYLAYGKAIRQFSEEERAELLLAFSDYLFSQIPWNTKRVEVIMNLPVWYRKILLLDSKNLQAKIKLAAWYSHSVSYMYPQKIQWIKKQEAFFANMSKIDLFNAYVTYSMFSMQSLETQKAYEYLESAKKIFPQNSYVTFIEENYAKGKIGF